LRIVVLSGLFPVLWETPFLNQITGLVQRGHSVDIYADQPQPDVPMHPDIDRLRLLERTYYPAALDRQRGRWREALRLIRSHRGSSRGILVRTLNPFVFWRRAFSLDQLRHTAPFLPPRQYDICYCPFAQDARKVLRLRRLGLALGKLAVAFRGSDVSRYLARRGRRAYRKVFEAGDLFLPVCEAFARKIEALGCPADRTVVHHTGINLDRFRYRAPQLVPGQPLRLLTVGRLVEKKGIEYAFRAIRRLIDDGLDVRYEVVGDGPLKPDLARLVQEMWLAERVSFAGVRTHAEVQQALGRAHILLAPCVRAQDGDEEGIPNVLREAMAVGVPVISTWHGGIAELITDAVTGFLVPERDSTALAARIRHLASSSPQVWLSLSDAARRRVEQDDIDVLNDRFVHLLENLCRPTGPAPASRNFSSLSAE
jgi:colanic acid/amylovoran biosynthesis glycosyltransferase